MLRTWFGPATVRWIALEDLSRAIRWSHRVDPRGDVTTRLRMGDGEVVDGGQLGVVLNRAWPGGVSGFAGRDHDYAVMELFALWLSWLAALPGPVVNPPSPRGLAGADRGPLEWLAMAADHGLPVRPTLLTTSVRRFGRPGMHPHGQPSLVPLGDRPALLAPETSPKRLHVLVAGERVVGVPDVGWHAPLLRLAETAGCPLLGVELVELTQGAWVVDGANPWPEAGTREETEAIAAVLARFAVRSS